MDGRDDTSGTEEAREGEGRAMSVFIQRFSVVQLQSQRFPPSCGIQSGLNEVIELHWAALDLHPSRSTSLNNFALSLRADSISGRSVSGVSSDLNEVIELHRAALDPVSLAMLFDPRLSTALRGSPSSHHLHMVKKAISSFAMDAFPYSVRSVSFTTAVELVEQGRAALWTQLARFRTPLDEPSMSGDTGAALTVEFK